MKWGTRLKNAWGALRSQDADKSVSSLSLRSNQWRGGVGSNMVHFLPDGRTSFFSWDGTKSSLTAYTQCPPVASVINSKTQAFLNGKTWLLNTTGRAKGKESVSEVAKKIKALLVRPNPLQSWKQFEGQLYTYLQIRGYAVVLPIKPTGFNNIEATRMWVLPPWMVEIEERTDVNIELAKEPKDFIKAVWVTFGGTRKELKPDDVFIFRDTTPSLDTLTLPESRIRALEIPISNIIGALESLGVLIERRGPSFVISSAKEELATGSMPLTPKERTEVEQEFAQYGLMRGQARGIITSANINLQTVGFNTKDLMLIEGIDNDTMMICDGFGYPYRLLSSNKGNSMGGTDAKVFDKRLYQNAIIPEAESLAEQWDQFFGLSEAGISFNKDFSHVPALQEDAAMLATARKTLNDALKLEWEAGLITLNDWKVKLGDDPLDGDLGLARATDPKSSDAPLASIIGVGGVQSLIAVLTTPGMSEEARRNTVEIVFGVSAADAARMVSTAEEVQNMSNGQQSNNQPPAADSNSGSTDGQQE